MKNNKVWFITGASKGFGLEIVKSALAAGNRVAATVRGNTPQLNDLLDAEGRLLIVKLDVTHEDEVKVGVAEAIAKFGQIDVLVNNAGYGLLGATEEATDQEVRKQYDTNVFGLLNVTRAVLPHMRSRKSGHIINISSLFGYGASVPGFGLYGSTKFAVEGISEGLALEVNALGIKVTAAAPGLFSTSFASSESYSPSATVLEAYQDTVGGVRNSIGHFDGKQPGDPAKLAAVILELAENENPPLHLPIGKDAVATFRTSREKTETEVAEWEAVSSSTDHITEAAV